MNILLGAVKSFLLPLLAFLLASCGATGPKVITSPAGPIDFKQYKTVKLVVLDSVMTSYSAESIPLFEGWLKDLLQSQDYFLVAGGEDMRIEIAVTAFQPGSKLLGWTYKFGKDAAALTYRASFRDRSGALITEIEGGKIYHGWEGLAGEDIRFMSSEQLRLNVIRHSVTQIAQFIQNNGKLE